MINEIDNDKNFYIDQNISEIYNSVDNLFGYTLIGDLIVSAEYQNKLKEASETLNQLLDEMNKQEIKKMAKEDIDDQ